MRGPGPFFAMIRRNGSCTTDRSGPAYTLIPRRAPRLGVPPARHRGTGVLLASMNGGTSSAEGNLGFDVATHVSAEPARLAGPANEKNAVARSTCRCPGRRPQGPVCRLYASAIRISL